mmetsp:Transcript_21123/g.37059  ORF Transcript_21123/g.37059 Transcript_21123/m.37059 type:complete len:527 (-) Transcript_21123:13-1593(-)
MSFVRPRTLSQVVNAQVKIIDVKSVRAFAGIAFVGGLLGTIAGGLALEGAGNLNNYATLAKNIDAGTFTTLRACVYILFTGSILLTVASAVQFWIAQRNKRRRRILLSSIVVLFCAAMPLASSIIGKGAVEDLYEALCYTSTNCTPRDDLIERVQAIVDVELAIFDTCCIANALEYSLQQDNLTTALGVSDVNLYEERIMTEPYGICSTGNIQEANCAGKLPAIIDNLGLDDLGARLCTCAPNLKDEYNITVEEIEATNACENFEYMQITLDTSTYIPTQQFSLLSVLTSSYREYFSLHPEQKTEIVTPIVGSPGPPWDAAAFPYGGFGCGLGMSKGFIWYTYLYAEENFSKSFTLGLASAGLAISASLLTGCFLLLLNSNDLDIWDYGENGRNTDFTTISSRSQQSSDSNPVWVPTRNTQKEARALGTGSKRVLVTRAEQEALQVRLNAFYAAYEPSKLDSNGCVDQDIVNFGLVRGEDALNAKLRAKYGADLQGLTSGLGLTAPNQKPSNLGANIMKQSVDDLI